MLRAITPPRTGQKALLLLIFFALATAVLGQQASLSVQGVLTKSDGTAVDDGDYSLTFKLWTAAAGGTAVHTETLPSVEAIGGVYSVVLGVNGTNITAPFDQTYYLGVSVGGGAELSPRPRLTHAPYALSLLGSSNAFPSSGTVGIGTAIPTAGNELHVKDATAGAKVLIEGTTNASIDLKKGATTGTISYDGTTGITLSENLNLASGKTIAYNGAKDWRLVDIDDFSTGNDGWACYLGATPRTFDRFTPNTFFSEGYILRPTQSGNDMMKKQFDLTGIPHTRVKVVFTYHFFDSWSDFEWGVAAFANALNVSYGTSNGQFQIGWEKKYDFSTNSHFSGAGYVDFINNGSQALDYNVRAEMIAQDSGDTFWVYFGSVLDQAVSDESYGISDIEIWVK